MLLERNREHSQSGKILPYSLCSSLGLLPNQSPNQVTDLVLPHRLEHAQILSQIIISSNMMHLNIQQDRWLRALVPLVEDPGLIPGPTCGSQPSVTLVPEDLMPSSELFGHQAYMVHTHSYRQNHSHLKEK